MAGERTEAATPRRLQTLRAEGRVARSADLSSAVGVLAAVVVIQQFGGEAARQLTSFMEQRFIGLARTDLTDTGLAELAITSGVLFLTVMTPLLVALPLVGVVAGVGQVGFLLSGKAIAPDWSRVNPLAGLQRLFSSRSLVELAKALFKIGILGFLLYHTYVESVPAILALATTDLRAAVPAFVEIAVRLGFTFGVALLALAALDYGYQRWSFTRDARMTREELKEEYRQVEGSPQVRAEVRKRQRRLASARMMQNVPKADVIITNPTHLAVALLYRGGEMSAPRVVAKGADLVAQRIKQIAAEHGVPMVENKPLAQALYRSVELDQEIPTDLFHAVAEVLAYIFSLKERSRGAGN